MKPFNPIGWCHFTVNFWWGCAKVSPACAHCYAEAIAQRFKVQGQEAGWGEAGHRAIRTDAALAELRRYDAQARKLGVRWRIFINSMSDTFEDSRDLDAARAALFAIAPTLTNLDLLLLTKRPEKIWSLVPPSWKDDRYIAWRENVWLGTTVENQATADLRIPELICLPAGVKFLSCEPLLSMIDLGEMIPAPAISLIDWVICGGESGPHARPMHPAWARSLREQCAAAGVPFYFNQWGEWLPVGQNGLIGHSCSGHPKFQGTAHFSDGSITRCQGQTLDGESFSHVGKKAAGRLLDGIEHHGFPKLESGAQP